MIKKENENDKHYLNAKQMKKYLKGIDNLAHLVIIRLLINGVSIAEIKKLRGKDVKYLSFKLGLKKPKRKISIDEGTNNLLISFLMDNKIAKKSKDKLFKYSYREIGVFINEYSYGCGFDFNITPTVLFNTFFLVKLTGNPDWALPDFKKHLGFNNYDYTQELVDYFKGQVEAIKENK